MRCKESLSAASDIRCCAVLQKYCHHRSIAREGCLLCPRRLPGIRREYKMAPVPRTLAPNPRPRFRQKICFCRTFPECVSEGEKCPAEIAETSHPSVHRHRQYRSRAKKRHAGEGERQPPPTSGAW